MTLTLREWPVYDHEFEVVSYDELSDEDDEPSPRKAVDLLEGAHTLTHP